MYCLATWLLIVIVFNWRCQAWDGYDYRFVSEKFKNLEEKLVNTIREESKRAEDRQRETSNQISEILQIVNKIYQPEVPQCNNVETEESTDLGSSTTNTPISEIDKMYQPEVPESDEETKESTDLTSSTTNTPITKSQYDSCTQVHISGRYTLQAQNETFEVYCDQELHGGGWIVIQSRFNGSVDFYRNWTEYRNGFGSLDGEFWLGLETIHRLTSSKTYELLVHLEHFDGAAAYARYQKFAIGSEDEKYALKTLDRYSGTAGDSLGYSKGRKFSTYDQDNDAARSANCAKYCYGAWWYGWCTNSNLNGKHRNTYGMHMIWWSSFRTEYGLKVSKMLIRANELI